jgi:hypothetical protein
MRVGARHAQQCLLDHDRRVIDQFFHGANASCKQIGQQALRVGSGDGTVADLILDRLWQFRHGGGVPRHVEDRVVAEAVGATRCGQDAPFDSAFGRPCAPVGMGQRHDATEARSALSFRHAASASSSTV